MKEKVDGRRNKAGMALDDDLLDKVSGGFDHIYTESLDEYAGSLDVSGGPGGDNGPQAGGFYQIDNLFNGK